MSSATEATRKAIYLSHFTPSMMPAEALESMLVQREPLLKTAVESIIQSVTTGSRHHQLFVGPRGIGKTHLISLIHHRVSQNKEVTEKALIAWMREEEWGVTSFFELVMRILRNLNLAYPALEIDKETQPLYDLKLKDAEVKASEILAKLIKDKVLIILMENLDDLFEQLGDAGQKQWRAFIQNHPQFVLVTTTPSLFSGVSAQKSVFYGFFDITQLDEFSFSEVVGLLEKIALYREDSKLAEFLKTPEGRARVRAVHHLAEGNPRIYIIFSQFLSEAALDELVEAFLHTIDELTPYYQARMKELSGQQRKILEYLVANRTADSVKNIARACFITSQVCSSQLKILKDRRYVRSHIFGRESSYELHEPLMRICMNTKEQRGEPIGIFVEFLKIWYSIRELKRFAYSTEAPQVMLNSYASFVLEKYQGISDDPKYQVILKEIENICPCDGLEKLTLFEELNAILSAEEYDLKTDSWIWFEKVKLLCNNLDGNELARKILIREQGEVEIAMKWYLQECFPKNKAKVFQHLQGYFSLCVDMSRYAEALSIRLTRLAIPYIENYPAQAYAATLFAKGWKSREANLAWESIKNDLLMVANQNKRLNRLIEIGQRMDAALSCFEHTLDKKALLELPAEERKLFSGYCDDCLKKVAWGNYTENHD